MGSPIQEFANNLKKIRKSKNLTQTQLAEKVGLTKQSILNYEKGLTFPAGKKLRNLLEALDVNAEQLLGNDLSQSTSERHLLEKYKEKGEYVAGFRRTKEYGIDENRQFLIDSLNKFSREEIYEATIYLYDKMIYEAHEAYVNDIAESLTDNSKLDMDIWVTQEKE